MLTDNAIKNLKLAEFQREKVVADGLGLVLRLRDDGSRTWIFRYTYNGQRKKVALGAYPQMSLKEARIARDGQAKVLEGGRDPVLHKQQATQAKREAITVGELAEEFRKRFLAPRYERPDEAYAALKRDPVRALKASTLAQDVTPEMLTKVFNAMVDRGSKVAANRTLALTRLMFQYGVDQHYLKANPVTMRPKAVGGRETAKKTNLLFEQIQDFLAVLGDLQVAMHPITNAALRFILGTAKRPLEVVTLEWSHIDRERRQWLNPWQLTKDKQPGKDHLVFLSQWSLNILDEVAAMKLEGKYVFPSPQRRGDEIVPIERHALSRAVLRLHQAGVIKPKFTPHDLRRTFATRAGSLKIPPYVVEKCLDHVMEGMMAVYNHDDFFEERREAMDRWGAKLAELESLSAKSHVTSD
jgi:integrase